MTSHEAAAWPAIADGRETFLAGVDFAVEYWLDFWRVTPDNSEAQRNALAHAVRALIRCVEYGRQPQVAVKLAIALHSHVNRRGQWHEWEPLLVQIAAWARPQIDDHLSIQLETCIGALWFRLNRVDETIALAQQRHQWATRTGNLLFQNGALIQMAEAYLNADRHDLALACAEQAGELARLLQDPVMDADALIDAARALLGLGQIEEAERRLTRAAELAREAGDAVYCCKAELFMGHAAVARQAWSLALRRFEVALRLVEGYGDLVGRGVVLCNMGRALTELGCWDAAEAVLREALAILHYHGNLPTEDICRQRLAHLESRRSASLGPGRLACEQSAMA